MRWLAVTLGYATIKWLTNGTGTNDVIDRCLELGLRKPVFRQDENFMVTLWRREGSGTVQSDPEVGKESARGWQGVWLGLQCPEDY